MKKQLEQVGEFHKAFGCYSNDRPTSWIPTDVWELRVKLIREELEEYAEASYSGYLLDTSDALADLLYVVFGTIIAHGLQDKIEEIFDEVHRSNMSKLDENGQPIVREDGKILKSSKFEFPDIAKVLQWSVKP